MRDRLQSPQHGGRDSWVDAGSGGRCAAGDPVVVEPARCILSLQSPRTSLRGRCRFPLSTRTSVRQSVQALHPFGFAQRWESKLRAPVVPVAGPATSAPSEARARLHRCVRSRSVRVAGAEPAASTRTRQRMPRERCPIPRACTSGVRSSTAIQSALTVEKRRRLPWETTMSLGPRPAHSGRSIYFAERPTDATRGSSRVPCF
jgi:hypothetical protein